MPLSEERRAQLKARGAIETTIQDFLGIDDAEMAVIDLRIKLANEVKRRRLEAKMSQAVLAKRMKISQPRIPSIESGSSVSLDTIVQAFFATGGSLKDLARLVAPG